MTVVQLGFDGAFHGKVLDPTPDRCPITLDELRTYAAKMYARYKTQIEAEQASYPGSNQTQRQLSAILQTLQQVKLDLDQCGQQLLPQYPRLPGYQPEHRRSLQPTSQQKMWLKRLSDSGDLKIVSADGHEVRPAAIAEQSEVTC